MKIDEQRSLVSLSVTTRPRAHDEFMQLLKESKDSLHYDQYYRQYQGQLQQSQLTFAPLQDLQGPLSRGNSPLADKPIKLAQALRIQRNSLMYLPNACRKNYATWKKR